MKYLFKTLIILAIYLLTSCNSESDWPQADKDVFIQECVKNASVNTEIDPDKYCSCMLDKVIEKYPKPEDALKANMEWMMETAQKCL